MLQKDIVLPTELKVISEEGNKGVFEIDKLYPGYGHTLGNSLRRVLLSSIPGVAVTRVFIDGVSHEFSTIEGVKEDVINIVLNLKKVIFRLNDSDLATLSLKVKGVKEVKASDIELPVGVEIVNPDQYLFTISNKTKEVKIDFEIARGLGYVPKESLINGKLKVGEIVFDASFTPIRRASYTVKPTRVGDRTDFNKLSLFVETDGSISPKQALTDSIAIMIKQFAHILSVEAEKYFDLQQELLSETPSDVKEDSIAVLDLSEAILEKLATAGVVKLSELQSMSKEEILKIEGVEEDIFSEIQEALKKV